MTEADKLIEAMAREIRDVCAKHMQWATANTGPFSEETYRLHIHVSKMLVAIADRFDTLAKEISNG